MTLTAFENARLIDPASGLDRCGTLLVENGRIVEVGARRVPASAKRIDCGGHVLCPALVDMRVFRVEPAAALAGGIGTLVLMPDQARPLDDAAMVAWASDPEPAASVRVRVAGAATQGCRGEAMAELGLMVEAGAVAVSDGRRAIADAGLMRRLLDYAGIFGTLTIQHAEEPALAEPGAMNEGETATRLGLPGIPAAAEAIMIERDARLLRLTGGRLHVAQVSAAESLPAIARAKDEGLRLSAGVSPQHLLLNESAVGAWRTFAKVSPPLRSEDDRRALVEAVREGTLDVICSGHEPRDQDAKRLPFSEAEPGIVGCETLLPLALVLYHNHDLPLCDLLATMTCRPADLLGIDAGHLHEGAPADLLLFDPERPWRIDPERLRSATQNTPFEGMPVQGRVLMTVVGGRVLFEDKG